MENKQRPTDAVMAEWKEKYKQLFEMREEIDGKEYLMILRKPTIKELESATSRTKVAGKEKPLNFNRNIIETCALYKDDEINESNEDVYAPFLFGIGDLVEIKSAGVKKL